MGRVVIVPGLAVRTYALPSARAVAARGHRVSLTAAPTWRGVPARLDRFGDRLAADLEARRDDVDLLIGMSVGTQVAAVAATRTDRIRKLLLLGAVVDPRIRTWGALVRAWRGDGPEDVGESPELAGSLRDWARAGPVRIGIGAHSSMHVALEKVLPRSRAELTVVHAERDALSTRTWAAELAEAGHGRLLDRVDAPHSWPVEDPEGFADLVDELLA